MTLLVKCDTCERETEYSQRLPRGWHEIQSQHSIKRHICMDCIEDIYNSKEETSDKGQVE